MQHRQIARMAMVLAGVLASPALAAGAAPDAPANAPIEGALITVTGKGLKDLPGDAVSGPIIIGRDRLLQTGANRLEAVLADLAGQQQFRRSDARSANATSQGITLRGLGGNASSRALLVLDGVPQADPFGGWVAFPAYATSRLGRVRVLRGGGSGYWGQGALAGTIELESAGPADLATINGSLAGGSRGSLDGQASVALVRDGGFATLGAAYARGDGFIPIVARQRGSADIAAPYEQASAQARAVVTIAPDVEAQASLSGFTDQRSRGTAFSDNGSRGADASLRLVGKGRWGWQALVYGQTRNFTADIASVNATRTLATQTLSQYATPASGVGGRLEIAPPIGHGITLRLGADTRQLEGATKELFTYVAGSATRLREAGGNQGTTGLFADATLEQGALTATLSGRVDWWQISKGRLVESVLATGAGLTNTQYADRSGSELTGRAGLALKAADWLTLRGAVYRGWRLPTLNELYRPFRVGADATAANALLRPEKLTGVDLGLTMQPAEGLAINATGFWNRMTDAIANVTLGSGPGTFPGVGFVAAGGAYRARQNLDALEVWGVELDARWQIGAFGARASISHVAPRINASGAAAPLNGLRPAQTPQTTLAAGLDYTGHWLTASATVRHIARQFEDDQNQRVLGAATMVDALLLVPLQHRADKRGLSLEARAENLFDAEVQAAVSATGVVERALPRTLWLGVRFAY